MKISQERKVYKPITITFETENESRLFYSVIDKLERKHCRDGEPPELTPEEFQNLIPISDALTDGKVEI